MGLASRPVIGIPPWRGADKMLATAERRLEESIARHGTDVMVYVAENDPGELADVCIGSNPYSGAVMKCV